MSTDQAETISALSKSVTDLDASRRVGWAKQYSAVEQLDEALKQLNVMRSERDIMRRHVSFLYGFVHTYSSRDGVQAEVGHLLKQHRDQIEAVLDSQVVSAGRTVAQKLLDTIPEVAAKRAAKAASKRTTSRASQRQFTAARDSERRKIMERFGFPNEAALWDYLSMYPGR